MVTRIISTALVLVYFLTNSAFAYVQETGFWKERAASLRGASLATKQSANTDGRIASPSVRNDKTSLTQFGRLSGPLKSPSILHIQDIHENFEAQTNIGNALAQLIKDQQVDLIAIEGAFGPIDLSAYHKFPYQDSVKKVADYLLREKKISGPIHTAMTMKSPIVVGIDDKTHYDLNVAAVKTALAEAPRLKKEWAADVRTLKAKKAATFNARLKEFDEVANQDMAFGTQVEFFARYAKPGPAAHTYLQALQIETTLDFARVEAERTQLIHRLAEKINDRDKNILLNLSSAFQSGRIGHAEFYETLKTLCANNGVSLNETPAMAAYVSYVLLSQAVDAEALLRDVRKMEDNAYAAFAKTPEEKQLIAASRQLTLKGKLLNLALTKDEWKEYLPLRGASFATKQSANTDGRIASPTARNDGLTAFEAFYNEAKIRDARMSENLERAIKTHDAKHVVFVTGGFHTISLENKSIITFVPKLTKIDTENGSAYLSVFAQEKTPLDRLFEGEKLFLANQQAMGLTQELITANVAANLGAKNVDAPALMQALGDDADVTVEQVTPSTVKLETSQLAITVDAKLEKVSLSTKITRGVVKTMVAAAVVSVFAETFRYTYSLFLGLMVAYFSWRALSFLNKSLDEKWRVSLQNVSIRVTALIVVGSFYGLPLALMVWDPLVASDHVTAPATLLAIVFGLTLGSVLVTVLNKSKGKINNVGRWILVATTFVAGLNALKPAMVFGPIASVERLLLDHLPVEIFPQYATKVFTVGNKTKVTLRYRKDFKPHPTDQFERHLEILAKNIELYGNDLSKFYDEINISLFDGPTGTIITQKHMLPGHSSSRQANFVLHNWPMVDTLIAEDLGEKLWQDLPLQRRQNWEGKFQQFLTKDEAADSTYKFLYALYGQDWHIFWSDAKFYGYPNTLKTNIILRFAEDESGQPLPVNNNEQNIVIPIFNSGGTYNVGSITKVVLRGRPQGILSDEDVAATFLEELAKKAYQPDSILHPILRAKPIHQLLKKIWKENTDRNINRISMAWLAIEIPGIVYTLLRNDPIISALLLAIFGLLHVILGQFDVNGVRNSPWGHVRVFTLYILSQPLLALYPYAILIPVLYHLYNDFNILFPPHWQLPSLFLTTAPARAMAGGRTLPLLTMSSPQGAEGKSEPSKRYSSAGWNLIRKTREWARLDEEHQAYIRGQNTRAHLVLKHPAILEAADIRKKFRANYIKIAQNHFHYGVVANIEAMMRLYPGFHRYQLEDVMERLLRGDASISEDIKLRNAIQFAVGRTLGNFSAVEKELNLAPNSLPEHLERLGLDTDEAIARIVKARPLLEELEKYEYDLDKLAFQTGRDTQTLFNQFRRIKDDIGWQARNSIFTKLAVAGHLQHGGSMTRNPYMRFVGTSYLDEMINDPKLKKQLATREQWASLYIEAGGDLTLFGKAAGIKPENVPEVVHKYGFDIDEPIVAAVQKVRIKRTILIAEGDLTAALKDEKTTDALLRQIKSDPDVAIALEWHRCVTLLRENEGNLKAIARQGNMSVVDLEKRFRGIGIFENPQTAALIEKWLVSEAYLLADGKIEKIAEKLKLPVPIVREKLKRHEVRRDMKSLLETRRRQVKEYIAANGNVTPAALELYQSMNIPDDPDVADALRKKMAAPKKTKKLKKVKPVLFEKNAEEAMVVGSKEYRLAQYIATTLAPQLTGIVLPFPFTKKDFQYEALLALIQKEKAQKTLRYMLAELWGLSEGIKLFFNAVSQSPDTAAAHPVVINALQNMASIAIENASDTLSSWDKTESLQPTGHDYYEKTQNEESSLALFLRTLIPHWLTEKEYMAVVHMHLQPETATFEDVGKILGVTGANIGQRLTNATNKLIKYQQIHKGSFLAARGTPSLIPKPWLESPQPSDRSHWQEPQEPANKPLTPKQEDALLHFIQENLSLAQRAMLPFLLQGYSFEQMTPYLAANHHLVHSYENLKTQLRRWIVMGHLSKWGPYDSVRVTMIRLLTETRLERILRRAHLSQMFALVGTDTELFKELVMQLFPGQFSEREIDKAITGLFKELGDKRTLHVGGRTNPRHISQATEDLIAQLGIKKAKRRKAILRRLVRYMYYPLMVNDEAMKTTAGLEKIKKQISEPHRFLLNKELTEDAYRFYAAVQSFQPRGFRHNEPLLPAQRYSVWEMLQSLEDENEQGSLLTSEPRTGKTITAALAAFNIRAENDYAVKRLLYTTSNAAKYEVAEELRLRLDLPDLHIVVVDGEAKEKEKQIRTASMLTGHLVLVCNYESVRDLPELITAFKPDAHIIDEAENLRGGDKTVRAPIIFGIPARYRIAITARLVVKHLQDVVEPLAWVRAKTFKNADDLAVLARDPDALFSTLDPIMVRWRRHVIMPDLVDPTYTTIAVPYSPRQDRTIHDMRNDLMKWGSSKARADRATSSGHIFTRFLLERMAGVDLSLVMDQPKNSPPSPKIERLFEIIEQERPLRGKVIVLADFIEGTEKVAQMVNARFGENTAVTVSSRDALSKRRENIRKFKEDEKDAWVLVGTSYLLGFSLNLHQATGATFHTSAVVRLTRPWWNVDDGDRLISPARKDLKQFPVRVYTLVSEFLTQPRVKKGGKPEMTVEQLQDLDLANKKNAFRHAMEGTPQLDQESAEYIETLADQLTNGTKKPNLLRGLAQIMLGATMWLTMAASLAHTARGQDGLIQGTMSETGGATQISLSDQNGIIQGGPTAPMVGRSAYGVQRSLSGYGGLIQGAPHAPLVGSSAYGVQITMSGPGGLIQGGPSAPRGRLSLFMPRSPARQYEQQTVDPQESIGALDFMNAYHGYPEPTLGQAWTSSNFRGGAIGVNIPPTTAQKRADQKDAARDAAGRERLDAAYQNTLPANPPPAQQPQPYPNVADLFGEPDIATPNMDDPAPFDSPPPQRREPRTLTPEVEQPGEDKYVQEARENAEASAAHVLASLLYLDSPLSPFYDPKNPLLDFFDRKELKRMIPNEALLNDVLQGRKVVRGVTLNRDTNQIEHLYVQEEIPNSPTIPMDAISNYVTNRSYRATVDEIDVKTNTVTKNNLIQSGFPALEPMSGSEIIVDAARRRFPDEYLSMYNFRKENGRTYAAVNFWDAGANMTSDTFVFRGGDLSQAEIPVPPSGDLLGEIVGKATKQSFAGTHVLDQTYLRAQVDGNPKFVRIVMRILQTNPPRNMEDFERSLQIINTVTGPGRQILLQAWNAHAEWLKRMGRTRDYNLLMLFIKEIQELHPNPERLRAQIPGGLNHPLPGFLPQNKSPELIYPDPLAAHKTFLRRLTPHEEIDPTRDLLAQGQPGARRERPAEAAFERYLRERKNTAPNVEQLHDELGNLVYKEGSEAALKAKKRRDDPLADLPPGDPYLQVDEYVRAALDPNTETPTPLEFHSNILTILGIPLNSDVAQRHLAMVEELQKPYPNKLKMMQLMRPYLTNEEFPPGILRSGYVGIKQGPALQQFINEMHASIDHSPLAEARPYLRMREIVAAQQTAINNLKNTDTAAVKANPKDGFTQLSAEYEREPKNKEDASKMMLLDMERGVSITVTPGYFENQRELERRRQVAPDSLSLFPDWPLYNKVAWLLESAVVTYAVFFNPDTATTRGLYIALIFALAHPAIDLLRRKNHGRKWEAVLVGPFLLHAIAIVPWMMGYKSLWIYLVIHAALHFAKNKHELSPLSLDLRHAMMKPINYTKAMPQGDREIELLLIKTEAQLNTLMEKGADWQDEPSEKQRDVVIAVSPQLLYQAKRALLQGQFIFKPGQIALIEDDGRMSVSEILKKAQQGGLKSQSSAWLAVFADSDRFAHNADLPEYVHGLIRYLIEGDRVTLIETQINATLAARRAA